MTEPAAEPSAAVVPARPESRTPVPVGVPLRSLDEAWRLATALALASLVPKDLRGKPSDVLAILLYGQELGLGPMQAVQSIYVVEGRPSMSAALWRARATAFGHRVEMTDHQPGQSVTVRVTRADDPGHPHETTFTLDDAVAMGKVEVRDGRPYARSQTGKPLPWETFTDDMLIARASARALRFKCPEVAMGLYATEELRDEFIDGEVVSPAIEAPAAGLPAEPDPTAPDEPPDVEVDEQIRRDAEALAAEFTPGETPTSDALWDSVEQQALAAQAEQQG